MDMNDPATELGHRVGRLELEALSRRVDQLEEKVGELGPPNRWRGGAKNFAPLLTPIVVALIGLYATVAITGAIDRQQLELSQLTAIRDLMVKLAAPSTDLPSAEATAVTLSAFGPPAIVPLIHELQAEGQVRPLAARRGLRTIAFQHHASVCAALIDVLQDHSRLFTWRTHRSAVELVGEIGCVNSVPVLHGYRVMFESDDAVERYLPFVTEQPEPDARAIGKLRESVRYALVRLENRGSARLEPNRMRSP